MIQCLTPLIGYTVPEHICSDGFMSQVQIRTHIQSQRQHAVKTLKPDAIPWGYHHFLLQCESEILKHIQAYDQDFNHRIQLLQYTADRGHLIFHYHREGNFSKIFELGPLPVDIAKVFMIQLGKEIQKLHSKNIIHGDLKLGNLLISDEFNVILIDFGFAQESIGTIQSIRGFSPGYSAPECREEKVNDEILVNCLKMVDIFSLGVIFFRLFIGTEPFQDNNPLDQTDIQWNYLKYLQYNAFWGEIESKYGLIIPDGFKIMIQGMLHPQSSLRWNIQQVMSWEWLSMDVADQIFAQNLIQQRLYQIANQMEIEDDE